MFMRLTLALLLLLTTPAVSGCWFFARRAEPMVGRDRDALFRDFGPPQQVKPDGKGGEVWIYVDESSSASQGAMRLPRLDEVDRVISEVGTGRPTQTAGRYGGTRVTVAHTVHMFWVDARGKIVAARTLQPD